MTGAAAKYEWSLNGTVQATTATYVVPASAKDGDEIKLTVTAEDGETASDTVYVGGLTILKVEPLAQGETYKYVKAYFSKALDSLSPSEIEIRGKKDQRLYSIQTAVLASDGMAADLTLYGNTDSDSTTFLQANTTYVMTLTQNGESTSLEFELPAYATDKIVTSVDMDKNTITTESSGKTQNTGASGIFNVAGKYDGNLGTLIGRTVSYQYDTDHNLTAFSLDDAEVIYGAMKFVNDTGDIRKAYFKDALTGETYKVNRDSVTASKNLTWFYAAEDGDDFGEPVPNTTYNYVKLVLNPDGTVSTANIVETLGKNLFVTSIDGTKVVQDKNNAFDLDGYIIVKDDKYIAPGDIEIGDVVFINTNLKFADVYTNEISGELSNVISGKLDIDDTTYNWSGSQYYSEDDDEYKTLSTNNNEASQAYLNSLDTETDTTIWIARNKNIVYIDGTVVGQTKNTYETYLVTKTAKSYQESLKNKFNVDVFDGTDTTTVTIDLSQLKFYKGVAGKYEVAAADEARWAADNQAWNFTGTSDNKYDAADLAPKTALAQGSLVKFMYNSTGAIVGLSNDEDSEDAVLTGANTGSSLDGKNALKTADSPNLKSDSKKLVQDKTVTATGVYKMGDYTNLWIWNEKGAKDDAYSKVVLTDYTNEIVTNNGSKMVGLTYRLDGTKVIDLVVHLTDDSFADAETNTINGVLVDFTKVGDTLTATVVDRNGEDVSDNVTFQWYADDEAIEGATDETLVVTVAMIGSTIKVVATAESGNTFESDETEAVTMVKELALESVEGAAQSGANNYNVVIAYFNQPVEDLVAGDIQIRRVSDDQLFAVESVSLSSDGMKATMTLANTNAAGSMVVGLEPNVDYNMIVTQDGETASKEFYIPASKSDVSVVAVNPGTKKITIIEYTASAVAVATTLNVPDDVDIDYENILGRTISVKYDKSNTITDLRIATEDVVYGAFKVVNTAAAGDGCLVDLATGEKYSSQAFVTAKSSIHETSRINRAVNGSSAVVGGNTTPTAQNFDGAGYTDGTEIAYAKLVLNSNGTVKVLQTEEAWTGNILVSKVNGTTVLGGTTEVSLKGYTIVENGETITTEDIVAGDVVFYNTTDKFAEVFTYFETGELEDVYSDRFSFEGKTYNESDATGNITYQSRYIKNGGGLTNVDDDYMTSLKASGKDITVYFDRAGNPIYVTGELAEVKTSSVTLVLTADTQTYDQSLVHYLRIKGFDGTEIKTYDADLSKIESITIANGTTYKKGYKPKTKAGTGGAADPTQKGFTEGTAKFAAGSGQISENGGDATANIFTAGATGTLTKQSLVTLTLNDSGAVIGINFEDNTNTKLGVAMTAPANLEAGLSSITYGGTVLQISGSTPVYIYDATNDTVKKVSYSDFGGTVAAANVHVFSYDEKNVKAIEFDVANLAGSTVSTTIEGVVAGVEHNPGSDNYMTKLTLVSGNAGNTETADYTSTYTKFAVSTIDTTKTVKVGDIVTVEVASDGETVNSVTINTTLLPATGDLVTGQAVALKSAEKQTFNISDTTLTGDLSFATSTPATIVQIVNGSVECIDFATFIAESEKYLTNVSMLGGSVAYVDTAVVTGTAYNVATFAAAKASIDLINTEYQYDGATTAITLTTAAAVKAAIEADVLANIQAQGDAGLAALTASNLSFVYADGATPLEDGTPGTTAAGESIKYTVTVTKDGYSKTFAQFTVTLT